MLKHIMINLIEFVNFIIFISKNHFSFCRRAYMLIHAGVYIIQFIWLNDHHTRTICQNSSQKHGNALQSCCHSGCLLQKVHISVICFTWKSLRENLFKCIFFTFFDLQWMKPLGKSLCRTTTSKIRKENQFRIGFLLCLLHSEP